MTLHIKEHREGFPPGKTSITRYDEKVDNVAISLDVWKLEKGDSFKVTMERESAFLLMSGAVCGAIGDQAFDFNRKSLFDESSSCIHCAAGTTMEATCTMDTEFTVYSCDNIQQFEPRVFNPESVANEPRGKGQVDDRCLRHVRTIFDGSNSDKNAELVLGEVVTMQGGWSSYPPHHHSQPEIYHYRFTEPQGYGHGELGETVLKVRNNDTVKILNPNDHAQCAAPGYGMYYSWVIRHLPGNPYTVPEFTRDHTWMMEPDANFWRPKS
jgi:5-deoxy-glucuronate isomerase